jgi:hypothetical protein
MCKILGGGIWEPNGVVMECYHIVCEVQPFLIGNKKFQLGGYDQDYFVALLVTLQVQKHKAFSYT